MDNKLSDYDFSIGRFGSLNNICGVRIMSDNAIEKWNSILKKKSITAYLMEFNIVSGLSIVAFLFKTCYN